MRSKIALLLPPLALYGLAWVYSYRTSFSVQYVREMQDKSSIDYSVNCVRGRIWLSYGHYLPFMPAYPDNGILMKATSLGTTRHVFPSWWWYSSNTEVHLVGFVVRRQRPPRFKFSYYGFALPFYCPCSLLLAVGHKQIKQSSRRQLGFPVPAQGE